MDQLDYHDLRRGDVLRPFSIRVTADQARAYLAATGEAEAIADLWEDTVPPLAAGALLLAGLMDEMQLPDGAVHVGQDFEFLQPIPVGAEVEACLSIAQHSVRQGARVIVFASELRCGGDVVMRGRTMVTAPAPVEDAVP